MSVLRTLSTGAPPSFQAGSDGSIYGVNGIDRPFVRDPKNGMRNWGIDAPPAAPTTALGAATGPTGTYIYKVTWENQNADIYGMYSAASTPLVVTNDKITVTRPSITVPVVDPQVTHWVVWRNTDGQATTFYRVASVAIGTATYTDDASDETVSAAEVLVEHFPLDGMFRYLKEFKGLIFAYGSRIESTGTVTVANGSANVQGNGTQFSPEHVNQKMYFTGDATTYTIASWAAASGAAAITISPVKSGGVTGVPYSIVAERPSDMTAQRSDDESFEAAARWPVFAGDGDFPSGMDIVGNTLCLYKQRHVYGYEFGDDPLPSGSAVLYPILTNRGLVNEWCSVKVGATAYNLDRVGVYAFDGAGAAEPVDLAIRRLFRPDYGIPSEDRINWAYTDTWRSTYDPVMHAAKWAVTTGSDAYPKTLLCFDLERQQWTVDRDPAGVRSFALEADSAGIFRAWSMDGLAAPAAPRAMGAVRQLDGTTGGTVAGNATGSGATTLTDGAAAFTTAGAGLKGFTVVAMTAPPQIRVIASNTGTVLTISEAWTSNPAVGTAYVVGAVESRWRYAWTVLEPSARAQADALILYFEPTSAAITFFFRIFKDFEANPILTWETRSESDGVTLPVSAKTDGWIKVLANEAGGRVMVRGPFNAIRAFSVEIMQLDGNKPVIVTGYDFEGEPHKRSPRAD